MAALVLDTGALIAADRDDRALVAKLLVAQRGGLKLRTTGIVVAEAWRDEDGRQANLARLLRSIDVRPVDEHMGRQAGALLAKSGTQDAADATVVCGCGRRRSHSHRRSARHRPARKRRPPRDSCRALLSRTLGMRALGLVRGQRGLDSGFQ